MKNQCFGGDYMGEVFDHMLKRMSYRRQKRWWNAYILFYRRVDSMEINNTITRSLNELTLCKCISLFLFCTFYRYMFAIIIIKKIIPCWKIILYYLLISFILILLKFYTNKLFLYFEKEDKLLANYLFSGCLKNDTLALY